MSLSPSSIFPILLLILISVANSSPNLPERTLLENSSKTSQFLASKRLLEDAYFNCPRNQNCYTEIGLDINNVLTIASGAIYEIRLKVGSGDEDLKISFASNTQNPNVVIAFAPDLTTLADERHIVVSPNQQSATWTMIIPSDTIKDYEDHFLFMTIGSRQRGSTSTSNTMRVEVLMSFEGESPLMIALIVIGAIAVVMSIVLGIWYLRFKKRQLALEERLRAEYAQIRLNSPPARGDKRLSTLNIDTRFPEMKFEDFDNTELKQTICSICLEDFKPGKDCRQLYCNHIFHSECIKVWLVNKIEKARAKIQCPNCNRDVSEVPQKELKVMETQKEVPIERAEEERVEVRVEERAEEERVEEEANN